MRLIAALLVTLCGAASASAAPREETAIAQAHYQTGLAYYVRGRYEDAAREFDEAYRLSPKPELLYDLARAREHAGDSARALAHYEAYLALSDPKLPDRATVEERVASLRKLVAMVTVRCDVDGASVLVDDTLVGMTPLRAAAAFNPGAHGLRVFKEGYTVWRSSLTVTSGQQAEVSAQLLRLVPERHVTPIYKRWWLWTIVGAAVTAGVVTTAVLTTRDTTPSFQIPGAR